MHRAEVATEFGRVASARGPRSGWRRATVAVLMASWLALAVAQSAPAVAAEPADDFVVAETVTAVAAFGVHVGFPAYRTAGVSASLQARFVGVVVRAGAGPGGTAFGLQGRFYPPLPIPVATYLGAGVDLYGGRVAPHAVVGLHAPLAGRWRLEAEVGVAWTPVLDEVRAAPLLGVGVAYAIPVSVAPGVGVADGGADAFAGAEPGGRCERGPPDLARLDAALDETVRRFVSDAVAAYGSVYRGLRYRTSTVGRAMDGDRVTVTVAYAGSVVEILTGRSVEASGTAEVDFRWDGCRWVRAGLRY
jgi:hypothetical protein